MSFNEWEEIELGEVIEFDPNENLKKGTIAKKIGMDKLNSFNREIQGFEFAEFKGGTKFRNGDTLLARITPCLENGKTAQVRILDKNEIAFGSTEFIIMREKVNKTINDYIYYLAISNEFRNIAIKSMTGTSGRQRAQKDVLKKTVIKLPSVKDQKDIAHILSTLDDKIELNNKINEILQSISQLLFKHWFIDFEFPNEEGLPYKSSGGEMDDSELGVIPKGWRIEKLSNLAEMKNGVNYDRNQKGVKVKVINVRNFNGSLLVDYEKLDSIFLPEKQIEDYLLQKFDTIIVRSAKPGETLLVDDDNVKVYSGFTIRTRAFDNTLKLYIFYCIRNSMRELENSSNGTIFKNLNQQLLGSLNVIIPSTEVIAKYNSLMKPIINKINASMIETNILANLRDTLLPKLMDGEIDLSNIEINQ